MTITELRALYFEGVKIVRAERRMRAYVFRDKPELMEAKLREMDRLLVILEQIKDAARGAARESWNGRGPQPGTVGARVA
jgi:hypothetical protein